MYRYQPSAAYIIDCRSRPARCATGRSGAALTAVLSGKKVGRDLSGGSCSPFVGVRVSPRAVRDMRFHGLDLNLLVALDALLTHQNVTRAAEQLNLSQSALSGALARLREHFDDELVVLVGGRMEPTPLARTLAEPLHDILLKTKSLVTTTASFDPQTSN